MKRFARDVLLASLLTACREPVERRDSDLSHAVRDVVARALPAVVRVRGKGDMAQGEGSGFFVKTDGAEAIVVTNHHVVWGAEQVDVESSDGTKAPATVVGIDRAVDIAVLRCSPKSPVQPLALGDDAEVAPGDWLVSMGDVSGLPNAVSVGVLSARSRVPSATLEAEKLVDYLFTDASLGPGSSGGPVLDLNGHVVGINAAMFGHNGALGVVIPSGLAQGVIQQLLGDGRSDHAFAGVEVVDSRVRPEASANRVRVASIVPHGPADEATVQVGDEILSVGGEVIRWAEAFRRRVFMAAPNSRIALRVKRAGTPAALTITLGAVPGSGGHDEGEALVRRSAVPFTLEQQSNDR